MKALTAAAALAAVGAVPALTAALLPALGVTLLAGCALIARSTRRTRKATR